MAEQNMWKKQMLANKNKGGESKPEPPKPAETTNPPPWAKNNQTTAPSWSKNNSTSETTNSQPPWAKNNSNSDATTSSQPPWAKNTTTPPSTINPPSTTNPPSTGTAPNPPWMKQNQQPTNNSPAVVKPSGNQAQNSPASQPSWMKTNAPAQQTSPSPPWANKNTAGSSSPQTSWANKAPTTTTTTNQQGGTNPPWMKGAEGTTAVGQNNNMMRAQKMADMEKEKKEMEEKQRQLEEEEKERKRQERIKREKQEEEANLLRELNSMQLEDELSQQLERQEKENEEKERLERERIERQERERREKQQQELRQREQRERRQEEQRVAAQRLKQERQAQQREAQRHRAQNQRTRLQNQRSRLQNQRLELQRLQKSKSRSGKKSHRGLQSSKISHISSIRGASHAPSSLAPSSTRNAFEAPPSEPSPSLPENLFHRYIRLLNQESSQGDYREKIALQGAVIQLQLQFKRECEGEIGELLVRKKVTNRKRKVVFSNSMQIRYGLCQGKRGEGKTEFSLGEGQRLTNLFLYYEAITKCIVGLMKRKVSIHFRVPLLNLATHKGITFLMEYLCPELLEINETDISLFQEVSNELLVLEKELELAYDARNDFLRPLSRNQLMVKKVTIYQEDYYVLYIKEDALETKPQTPSKTHQQSTPIPTLNYLKLIEYVTGETAMLPFYSPPLLPPHAKPNDISQKTAPPACKQLMREIALANAINTVYSSCQGEVQEGIFFDLILNQNKEVWEMIKAAGFPETEQPSAVALAYLQRIAALRFAFTESFFSGKRKSAVESVLPAVFIQKHEFQMLEFIKNAEKYMAEEKEELVEESMRMNRELWEEIERGSGREGVSVLKVKREVAYLLFRGKEGEALQLLQSCQERLPAFAIENIPLSLLFLKIHIKTDAEIPLLTKLSELLKLLQFYFKEETIIHSYVYTIVGSYYSGKSLDLDREGKVVTFYEHAINIAVRLYGEKAQEVAEIYLSRAKAMLALTRMEAFQKDMGTAVKIYRSHSKNNAKIAECNYLLGRVACVEGKGVEGVELMESSSALFLKMGNYIQSLRVGFQLLPFLEGEEHKYEMQMERIVEVCFRHKSVWAFQRVTTLLLERELHCYTSLTIESLLLACAGEGEEGGRSKEEVMIDLEEEIKGFTSFIEIVRWSLSILAAKTLIRKETSSDYWKALAIMRDVIHFYQHPQQPPSQGQTQAP